MRALLFSLIISFLLISPSTLALSDTDYLPTNVKYNPKIPTPASVLGYPVGTWHVRHDQLAYYMRELARTSDRVSIIQTGQTHEQRPLVLLKISAAHNQPKLETLRKKHLQQITQGGKADTSDPLVIWMGYGVHGNEPSASNAALLVAYYLAAAEGEAIDTLLDNAVVLLDPSLNPDGLSRFAQWANMHKGKVLNPDSQHREHLEDWPSGRTNHYWFDLNRDWLPLVHPESQARIKQFHQWRPHVLTDFHEMGTNDTYFFQPGIPSRKNPWTPEQNVRLTQALANHHAKALDRQKQLYYTEESYDDFYYGKGSTYPDGLGSIGILFEQASSRGHLQESINGDLSFVQSIQNQVTTSLSTFAGAVANKQALLQYHANFREQTEKLQKSDKIAGYLVGAGADHSKLQDFANKLRLHQIKFDYLGKAYDKDQLKFVANQALYVPLAQEKYRLIKSMFSTRTSFNDNSFYDVSNWNLALAYNLPYTELNKGQARKLSLTDSPESKPLLAIQENAYSYSFSWQDSNAPRLLQSLLDAKVKVRIAGAAFSAQTTQGQVDFSAGSVLIPLATEQPDNLYATLNSAQTDNQIQIWSLTSGLTAQGIDLGSRRVRPLKNPKVMIVGGRGVSQYEAGEVWHFLDQTLNLNASVIELERLSNMDLTKYSHMIWVNGRYQNLPDKLTKKITDWIKRGGVLVGQKAAAKWFSDKKWLQANFVKPEEIKASFDTDKLNFSDREAQAAKARIAGAVFAGKLDLSHPLTFGLSTPIQPLFRNHTLIMEKPDTPFITVAEYTESPLMAGFTAPELQKWVGDSAAIVAHRLGKGRVIAFADNPLFRGYWRGTQRLFANAIYQAGFITPRG